MLDARFSLGVKTKFKWPFSHKYPGGFFLCFFAVFGSTVKAAVTRRGVSYLERLAVGVERLEEESRLSLSERR